jgi:hypothetical protein
MEALNHCTVRRVDVRSTAAEHGLGDRVTVPEDGEVLTL